MHSNSESIEIAIKHKADEVKDHFQLLFSRYQIGLETSMRGSDLFDRIHLFYYECHNKIFKQGGSYIGSPD